MLRREHVTNGHCALRKLLQILKGRNIQAGRVTMADVKQFVEEGCGICESAKMRTRSFARHTLADHTPAPVGKNWVSDALSLRVPSAEHGYLYILLYICATSTKKIVLGMHGQTVQDHDKADNQLRAAVRPVHGDIHIRKRDAHPTHRALAMSDLLALHQEKSEIAPPHLHS